MPSVEFMEKAAFPEGSEEGSACSSEETQSLQHSPSFFESRHGPQGAKLTLLPLIALIFFEVSGGPFGVEDAVKHGGPLLAILGFTVFPLVWSIPEALVTAELSTAYPENGGFVVWVSAAFGPFWGFQVGWYKWLSGVIDNALYPILFLDYLKHQFPAFEGGIVRGVALISITTGLTYWNYRGLVIVGFTALLLTIFGLMPFVVLCFLSIPKLKPRRWLAVDWKNVHWRGYLNNLFWNLNYWDSASTLAGEVDQPKTTFPRALLGAVVLVVLAYLFPLLAGTGAFDYSPTEWNDGFFAVVASKIGGKWLGVWITCAAALSTLGAFETEMSSDAFQLLGMAERGMLPEIFTYRSKHGTPVLAILCSASGIILLSWMAFSEIVEFLNFLYCFGMFLEFGAFIALRFMAPDLERPYTVPVNRLGAVFICIVPSVLLLFVMSLASPLTIGVSLVAGLLGAVVYPLLMWAKHKGWVRFVINPELPEVAKMEELEEDTVDFEDKDEEDGEGSADSGSTEGESLLQSQSHHHQRHHHHHHHHRHHEDEAAEGDDGEGKDHMVSPRSTVVREGGVGSSPKALEQGVSLVSPVREGSAPSQLLEHLLQTGNQS